MSAHSKVFILLFANAFFLFMSYPSWQLHVQS